ncbi:chloroquine resistance transporter, putative [Plasmodium knowlesi strain H]|uniref:Putative chloroquine resistance transporter n=4 Tax=Plasmodium knowlesi TaxID=5850 RepID=CRT_PLAKN|nr:chloroquine resistance transporter, putative [Plasmodium knowlesi strain H]Q9GSD7.1 RecName: Full=Putative chloroquine resistance transporter; AltName: Full=Probable transporter cg10; Short=pkcg10; AltName: Full=pfcrt homolog [Plasmodium knowlesi]AAG27735.1 putative transporter protein CG10 [Plasmodium knowlesi]OTN68751.1 putative chloroquine resistance transporter [Plasmodium knowlesi]CAA9986156.1 chloroquine resistance transporter, putative [Plasmodium knowlesi strain H]SBO25344.1 chloroq
MKILKKKKKGNQQIVPDERYRELDSHAPNENEIADEAPMSRKILYYLKLVYHEIRENITIYLLIILYLCVCVMNKIMAKRTLKKIGNYSFVTSETHNTICMVVFFSLYFIFGRRVTSAKERHQNFGLQFLLISLLDACSVIIAFIGLTRTTGNIQSFVMQLSIPINMFFCFLILRYRYHLFNYVGASIIVLTIAIVEFILSFETQEENSIVFNLVLIASLIPMSFSNMTREIVFKKYKINILRLNAVVSFFQIFTSCLMLPMYTLPFLKQINLPFSEIGTNIKNGFRCLILGQNTIVENCGLGMAKMCDDCEGAWKTFLAYSFFNICDNLITSFIIDKFSTMTYTIVSCIQGPAIAIAYYFKFLAGDAVMKPRVLDFVTLFGYLFGSIIYRVGNIILEKKKMMEAGNDDDSEGELTNAESIITQ